MKRHRFVITVSCIAVFSFLPAAAKSGQDTAVWNILSDVQGKVAKMSIVNPRTPLSVEREITLDIDKDGNPVRGDVLFANSASTRRELKPREMMYYWDELKGAHALWDYLSSQEGRLADINPKSAALPLDAFGRQSRIVTDDNREFIGKLNAVPNNPDCFTLDVEGSQLTVYKIVIREIQQMK
jgi:hypothetical protein